MVEIDNGANLKLLKALNGHGVEYLIVGGLAVAYYCPQRQVGDLDLVVNRTLGNAQKIWAVLTQLGGCDFDYTKLIEPKIQIPFKFSNYEADILTPEEDFDFSRAFSESNEVKISGVHIRIPSVKNLITLISASCEKGRHDINLLNHLILRGK